MVLPAAARDALKELTLSYPSRSLITVRNDYEWMGDPRAGEFVTYIDGRYAGSVILGETKEFPVNPGSHTLRVRNKWFMSRRKVVDVPAGSAVDFRADIPKDGNFLRRMSGLWDPFHWLVLEETQYEPSIQPD
jgi:hypothetical protein